MAPRIRTAGLEKLSDADWQAYERAIEGRFRNLWHAHDILIERNKKLKNLDGNVREVDVLISLECPDRVVRIAIEAKNRARKFGSGDLDAIIGKFQDIGVHLVDIYSVAGFTVPVQRRIDRTKTLTIETHHLSLEQALEESWSIKFFDSLAAIQVMRKMANPSGRDCQRVFDTLLHVPWMAKVFFDRLDNPAWLRVFHSKGRLRDLVSLHDTKFRRQFRVHICSHAAALPVAFIDAARMVDRSDIDAIQDFLFSSSSLGTEEFVRFCEFCERWDLGHRSCFEVLCQTAIEVLGRTGSVAGIDLIRKTMTESMDQSFGSKEDARNRLYRQVDTLDKVLEFSELESGIGELHNLVVDLLYHAEKVDRDMGGTIEPTYSSSIQNSLADCAFGIDLRTGIEFLLIRVMMRLVKTHPKTALKFALGAVTNGTSVIHKRVALLASSMDPGNSVEVAQFVIQRPEYWGDALLRDDLQELIQGAFGSLRVGDQEACYQRVVEAFPYSLDGYGDQYSEDYYNARRLTEWLILFKESQPRGPWVDGFEQLRAELVELTGISKLPPRRGPQIASVSSAPEEAYHFSEWTPEEVLRYCADARSKVESAHGFGIGEVGRLLSKDIAERPEAYLAYPDLIAELTHPFIFDDLFWGLREAAKSEGSFSIVKSCEVIEYALTHRNSTWTDGSPLDPEHLIEQGVIDFAAEFLQVLCQRASLPFEECVAIFSLWKALRARSTFAERDLSADARRDLSPMPGLIIADTLLMILGKVQYEAMVEKGEHEREGFLALMSEIEAIVDAEVQADSPPGFLSAFAMHCEWTLESRPNWVAEKLEFVFPDYNDRRFATSWDAFLNRFRKRPPVITILEQYFIRANRVAFEAEFFGEDWIFHTGKLMGYVVANDHWTQDSQVVREFLRDPNPRMLEGLLASLRECVRDTESNFSWADAKYWFDHILETAPEGAHEVVYETIQRILPAAPEDTTIHSCIEWIDQLCQKLDRQDAWALIAFLQPRATAEPLEAARAVKSMVPNKKELPYNFVGPEWRKLLETIHQSNNEEAIQILRETKEKAIRNEFVQAAEWPPV